MALTEAGPGIFIILLRDQAKSHLAAMILSRRASPRKAVKQSSSEL